MAMSRRREAWVLAAAAALALGGCGPSPSNGAPAGPSSTSAPTAGETTAAGRGTVTGVLKTATVGGKTFVVDSRGMTLYHFTQEVKDSGTSSCTEACLELWPPALASDSALATDRPAGIGVSGVTEVMRRDDGQRQVTIDGRPLYYYAKDNAPGEVNGQGVGGQWYVVAPDGVPLTEALK